MNIHLDNIKEIENKWGRRSMLLACIPIVVLVDIVGILFITLADPTEAVWGWLSGVGDGVIELQVGSLRWANRGRKPINK